MGTLRRECIDHIIVVNERHLQQVLRDFIQHCTEARPHQALELQAPEARARASPPTGDHIVARPVLGGLTHEYGLADDAGTGPRAYSCLSFRDLQRQRPVRQGLALVLDEFAQHVPQVAVGRQYADRRELNLLSGPRSVRPCDGKLTDLLLGKPVLRRLGRSFLRGSRHRVLGAGALTAPAASREGERERGRGERAAPLSASGAGRPPHPRSHRARSGRPRPATAARPATLARCERATAASDDAARAGASRRSVVRSRPDHRAARDHSRRIEKPPASAGPRSAGASATERG